MMVVFRAVVERRVLSVSSAQIFFGRNRLVTGPVPMGYVLVEVATTGFHKALADTIMGWSLSNAREASTAAFGGGISVLDTGEKAFGTKITVMRTRLIGSSLGMLRFPVWLPVPTGGMRIHCEWETVGVNSAGFIAFWFTFERWEEVTLRGEEPSDGSG